MKLNLSDQLYVELIQHIKEHRIEPFRRTIKELQPYDVAEFFKILPLKHRHRFLSMLTVDQAAELVQQLEVQLQTEVLQALGADKLKNVLNRMQNDDLADLLSEIPEKHKQDILRLLHEKESQSVQELLTYDPNTAGGIMTNRFVWIRNFYTVKEAIDKIRSFAEFAENIYYLYVIDEQKKLVGVVSYRDLILAEKTDLVQNIMFTRVISVPAEMHQEEVAKIIERYDFIAVPVVDHDDKLLGIITVDDVIDVVIQEANEDYEKLAASGKSIDFNTRALTAASRRLPWLILLLFLGLVSGTVLAGFEDTLEQVVVLAFFMPMIAGMTGNTGTQSLAIVVRGLVNEDIKRKAIMRLLFRETGVGLLIGLVCGLLVALIAYLWHHNPYFSLVIGMSLSITLVVGTLAGTIIPLLLYRFKADPAIASGPLITTLNDIFSLTIYFGTATIFLPYLT